MKKSIYGPGVYRGKPRVLWTDEKIEEIRSLIGGGIPMAKIGKRYGVSKQRIYQIARQYSIETNVRTRARTNKLTPEEYSIHGKLVEGKRRTKGLHENDGELSELLPLPKLCPVLGIRLEYLGGLGNGHESYASIDRIDCEKGYDRGNIHIISYKANRLKNNGTVDELQKIVNYFTNLTRKSLTI